MPEGQKKQKCKSGAPEYMLTYGDMVTLLLTFFVMLLTMANFEKQKVIKAISSFQKAMGIMPDMTTVAVMPEVFVPRMGGEQERRRLAVKEAQKIVRKAKKQEMKEAVKVKVTEKGIAVKLSDPRNFVSGSAELSAKVRKALAIVAETIRGLPNDPAVRVEGHTDNIPIRTTEFKSNWHLSSARALNVIEFLSEAANVPPRRLQAIGYGEFRPIATNATAEGRRKNRRIEIYIDFVKKKDTKLKTTYWAE